MALGERFERVRGILASWSGLLAVLGALGLAGGLLLVLWVPDLRLYGVPTIVVSAVVVLVAIAGSALQIEELIRSRRGQLSGLSLATIGAGLAGFAALNVIAASTGIEWDLTATRQFELAPQTVSVLGGLRGPVQVTGFVIPTSESDLEFEAVAESHLSRFVRQSDLISYRFVDPQREPSVARDFGVTRFPTLVVSSADTGLTTSVGPDPVTEQSLLTAVLTVSGTVKHRVYFTTGHGERDSTDLRAMGGGLGFASAGLSADGYETASFDLTQGRVPDDASLVIIADPVTALAPPELAALVGWLRDGGRAVLMVEPSDADQPLAQLLGTWGLEVEPGTVDDPERSAPGDSHTLLVQRDQYRGQTSVTEGRAIVEPIGPTMFPGAAAFRPAPEVQARILQNDDLQVSFEPLVVTSDDRTVHLLVEASGTIGEKASGSVKTKLAVMGDTDFASNRYLDELANRDFFLNVVGWLLEDDALVSVRPRQDVFRPLVLTAGEFDFVRYVAWFLLPAAAAAAGVVAWWRRR